MKGMFSRLMALLRDDAPTPRYGTEGGTDDDDAIAASGLGSAHKAALADLVALLAARLGSERAAAMATRAVQTIEPHSDAAMAFANGTNLEVEDMLSIYVDWKGDAEVEWQANRIFETLELPDRWQWRPAREHASPRAAFQALEDWLAPRGYRVWHVMTDGDDVLAFPVLLEHADLARQLADKAGFGVFALQDADPYYGPAD